MLDKMVPFPPKDVEHKNPAVADSQRNKYKRIHSTILRRKVSPTEFN